MENIGELLKNSYSLIHEWKYDEAKNIFESIHNSFNKQDFIDWKEPIWNYTSCLLWLWEIYMKQWNLEQSLEYYLQWEELTKWTDFNILFNIWVVYSNLKDFVNSKIYLEKAKKLDPKNPNLLAFLWTENSKPSDNNKSINKSFKDKIQEMMKKVN